MLLITEVPLQNGGQIALSAGLNIITALQDINIVDSTRCSGSLPACQLHVDGQSSPLSKIDQF